MAWINQEDYSGAIGAYARAAYAYARRGSAEKTVEEYFAAKLKQNPKDSVAAGQREQAERRRKAAEKDRDRATDKKKKARKKFLEE